MFHFCHEEIQAIINNLPVVMVFAREWAQNLYLAINWLKMKVRNRHD